MVLLFNRAQVNSMDLIFSITAVILFIAVAISFILVFTNSGPSQHVGGPVIDNFVSAGVISQFYVNESRLSEIDITAVALNGTMIRAENVCVKVGETLRCHSGVDLCSSRDTVTFVKPVVHKQNITLFHVVVCQ